MNIQQIFKDPFAFVLLAALALISILLFSRLLESDTSPQLQGIQHDYSEGEKATTAEGRKTAFNRSLETLLDLEKNNEPYLGNGNLYLHIGDNYFHLEEFPKAILYYNRALALRPRDVTTTDHLSAAQSQLKINQPPPNTPGMHLFFWHYFLSIPERLQFFTAMFLCAIAFAGCYLWFEKKWLSYGAIASLAVSGILLLSLAVSYYFSPMEAVIVTSSPIYRDAGEQYATVMDQPIPSGLKVKVLDVVRGGMWLKVQTSDGVVGYIPFRSAQII